MEPKINFIFPAETARKILFYLIWGFVVILLFLILFLAVDGKSMKDKIPEISERIAAADTEYAALPAAEPPGETQISGLIVKVSAINRLKIGKSSGLSNIMSVLEKLSSGAMTFISFQYSLEDRTLIIEARAKTPEIMQKFMESMEKNSMFKNVLLQKQSQKVSSSGNQVTDFTIKAEENLR